MFPDAVVGEKFISFGEADGEGLDEGVDVFKESIGEVASDTTGANVGGVHAGTGDAFIEFHEFFTFFKAVEVGGHSADVEGVAADGEKVVEEACDFEESDADPLCAFGDAEGAEFFDGEAVGVFLSHHGDVVEAIEVGKALHVGFTFHEFFSAAVSSTDVGVGAFDDFAVEFEDETKDTVSGGVLRAEVDGEGA